jgi:hypothetical protein
MGVVAIVCAVGALTVLSQNLGIAALRMQAEKLEQIFAILAIIFSFIPPVYAVIILTRK